MQLNDIDVNNSRVMKNEFHLEVSNKMIEIDARILLPPTLQYKTPTKVYAGKWTATQFYRFKELTSTSWVIVNISGIQITKTQFDDFTKKFQSAG